MESEEGALGARTAPSVRGGVGDSRGRGCKLKAAHWGQHNRITPSSSRPKGTMVTYGGMAKQPVMVPVVSTGDALDLLQAMSPLLHCRCPRLLGSRSAPRELSSPLPAN